MTDSQNERPSAQSETTPDYAPPRPPSGNAVTLRWVLAAVMTFVAVPYLWARTVATWMLMDLLVSPWSAALAFLILAVAGLMYRLDTGDGVRPFRWFWVVVFFVVWFGIGAVIVLFATSPFMDRTRFIPIYVLSTLWILWLWVMPLTSLKRPVRATVFVLLLLCAPAFPALVTFEGLDGDARPIASWRFATRESRPAAPAMPLVPASAPAEHAVGEIPAYPQFLGPDRIGVVTGLNLSHDLSTNPPREVWRHPVGLGWGAFATQASRAVTQEQRGDREVVVCYDLLTGSELWAHADEIAFRSGVGGDGPRATPTIHQSRVYSLGATGRLNCLELATGKRLWTVNILEDNEAENLYHGMSGSPLVVNQLVVVSPGGGNGKSLVAYDKDTGKAAWRSGNDAGGYGSPTVLTIAKIPQILILNSPGVSAHNVETGAVLWTHPWKNTQGVNCSQPLLLENGKNQVLVATGYGKGSCLIELSNAGEQSFAVKQLWTSRGLKTKFCSAVVRGTYAYGLDNGILVCIDLTDGSRKWKKGRYGHGQILLADDLLIVQAERGDLAFVKATPEAFEELYRMPALDSKTWNNPALAGRFLLVRNDREAVCYELPQNK